MDNTRYHYSAKVISIHDGDTIKVDIDLGFGVILKNQTFRFFGLNTPEIYGLTKTAGMKSLAYVKKAINKKDIIIISIKDGKEKYGRWLGKIYYQNGDQWMDLNQELIDKGLAIKYMDNGAEV